MNNHVFFRGSASREADEIKATLRDTADAVQEINARLAEDRSAPAAPPAEAAAAEAPPARADHNQAIPAKEAVPGSSSPPLECKASTASPSPEQRTTPAAGPACAAFLARNAPVPLTLPAVPDYSRQFAEFASTVVRNQETMLRTIERTLAICRRQDAQIQAQARQIDKIACYH